LVRTLLAEKLLCWERLLSRIRTLGINGASWHQKKCNSEVCERMDDAVTPSSWHRKRIPSASQNAIGEKNLGRPAGSCTRAPTATLRAKVELLTLKAGNITNAKRQTCCPAHVGSQGIALARVPSVPAESNWANWAIISGHAPRIARKSTATPTSTKASTGPARASAVHCAAGFLARKATGLARADTGGTPSTQEGCAPPASTSGLQHSAVHAPAGRLIRSGTRSNRKTDDRNFDQCGCFTV
jgi:hypothetical protein